MGGEMLADLLLEGGDLGPDGAQDRDERRRGGGVHGGDLADETAWRAGQSVWGGFADAVRQAAGQMLTQLFGWWTATGSTPVETADLRTAQQLVTSWVALPVAVLALLAVVAWGVADGGDGYLRDTFCWDRDTEDLLIGLRLAAAIDGAPLPQVGAWLTTVCAVEPRNILGRDGSTRGKRGA